MDIKLTHSKEGRSLNVRKRMGRLQVKKAIYNKAFRSFIEENYGAGIHFGSMNNNLQEVLNKLKLNDIMEGSVKLPYLDMNSLTVVNDTQNEFSDFDPYESFTCTFYAKEGVNPEKFTRAIEKLNTHFISTHNVKVNEEIAEIDYNNKLESKKREIKEITFFIVIAIIAAIGIYFFSANN